MNDKFDLNAYRRAVERMIAANTDAYTGFNTRQTVATVRDYTPEEIERILESGSLSQ